MQFQDEENIVQFFKLEKSVSWRGNDWLVVLNFWLGGLGFNGPLRQYFSLYRAVSQRERERGEKG